MLQTQLGLAYWQQKVSIFWGLTPTTIQNLRADTNTSNKGVREARGCLPISPSCPVFRLRGRRIASTSSFFERLTVWRSALLVSQIYPNPPNACRLPFQIELWDMDTYTLGFKYITFICNCVCLGGGIHLCTGTHSGVRGCQIPWSWNHIIWCRY